MQRRNRHRLDIKPPKPDTKTQLTQSSSDREISLELKPSQELKSSSSPDSKPSSESSEYEQKKSKKKTNKTKKSLKKTPLIKQTTHHNKPKNKHPQAPNSPTPKNTIIQHPYPQMIMKKYSSFCLDDIIFQKSLQRTKNKKPTKRSKAKSTHSTDHQQSQSGLIKEEKHLLQTLPTKVHQNTKKQQKPHEQQQDIEKFIQQYGELHITDVNLSVKDNHKSSHKKEHIASQTLYTFQPKYELKPKVQKNYSKTKIMLTKDEIAERHDLFIELVRFYENMADPSGLFMYY